jgi:paraquat-inducible protein A
MNSDTHSFCIKCGESKSYDSRGACKICGSIIAIPSDKLIDRSRISESNKLPKQIQANASGDFDTIVVALYVMACIAFLLGIFLPFVTVLKQFAIFGIPLFRETNTVSMVTGILSLLSDGQWLLFFILLLFSIIFPVLKLAILYPICCDRGDESNVKKQLKFLAFTGKWSMLDVVVIGILVVTLKLGDMVEVKIHSGIYFFTASVLLSMIISTIAGLSFTKK